MNKQIRCAIYDRVSTEIQVQQGLSLDAQKQLLTDYATSHNYEIVGFYADEGITARKKLQNRKDFMRLLRDIEQNKIDLVLVTKLDRWFRNVRDYHNTQAILEKHHCNWKTILEDYDTSTADGQLKINIMLAVAQNESDRTSERIKVVFEHKRRNGEHINGRPPYGYKIVSKKPVKDENTKAIVEDYFQHYFATFSKRKTIEYITEKYGNTGPSPQMMDKMLKKEIYCGIRGSDLHYCEPYITQEQFELIKTVCSSKTYKSSHESYVFSQLMKCPHCGATMTGFTKKHKCKDGSVSLYKRYRCSNKFSRMHPPGACITESIIEEYLIKNICPELNSILYNMSKHKREQDGIIDYTPRIMSEMDRLNLLFQKGRVNETYYDAQYVELEKKLLDEKRKHKETPEDYENIRKQFADNWLSLYEELDAEHKNSFWKRCVKEIYIDKDSHKICGFSFMTRGCSK